jgi:hypothetical protein
VLLLISALALGAIGFLFFTIYKESRTSAPQAGGVQALASNGTLCDWLSPPATVAASPATTTFGLLVKRPAKVRIVLTATPPEAGRLISVNDGSGTVDLSGQPVSTYDATTDAEGVIAVAVTLEAAHTATLAAVDLASGDTGQAISFAAQ